MIDHAPQLEDLDHRVLVLAPIGRDAALTATVLSQTGAQAVTCTSIAGLCDEIARGAAALVITDEALDRVSVRCLVDAIADQPPWSDLPIVLLTTGSSSAPASRHHLDVFAPFGNVTVLERP